MKSSIQFWWVGFVWLLFISWNKTPEYLTGQPASGDGVYSFLRRYELDRYACNHDQFYKLNKLKKNAPLQPGREYQLPILIYRYNGKSIRSTIGVDDWSRAVRIQNFNESMLEKKLRAKTFQASKILWVPYHELHCPQPTIPTPEYPDPESIVGSNKPRHYSIFGDKYAYTPLESQKLKGNVYYVSSGHGGPDPGAIGRSNGHKLCEDEYAYDVGLRLVRLLIAHGATAYMVNRDHNDGIRDAQFLKCDSDEVIWGNLKLPLNQKARLFQRSDAINDLYFKHKKQGILDQKALEIHVDSRSKSARADVYFYHYPGDKKAAELAKNIHATFVDKYKIHRKGNDYQGTVTARDLHMLRECKPTTVFIELANIQNPSDLNRILPASNRQALANWLFEGLLK